MWDMPHYCCSECRLCNLNIIDAESENHKKTCINSEICQCVCHEPDKTVIHVMACCHICKCGDRIKGNSWESHSKHCAEMQETRTKQAQWDAVDARRKDFLQTHSEQAIKRVN